MADLLPASDSTIYRALPSDRFADGPFWDQDKWPRVTRFFEDHRASTNIFNEMALAAGRTNPARANGMWSFRTGSLGYELRCYLWHYFRSVDKKIYEVLPPSRFFAALQDWPWTYILAELISNWSLAVLTFNYDVFLEYALPLSDYHQIAVIVEEDELPSDLPINSIPIYKLHGSLSHLLHLPFFAGGAFDNPNPWLRDDLVEENTAINFFTETVLHCDTMPMLPDLVPPGFAGDDICNPLSKVSVHSKRCLQTAGVVIVCGLSGRPPDTEEVTDLLNSINENAAVYSVGREDAIQDTPVNSILRGLKVKEFSYIGARDLRRLLDILRR